MLRSSQVLCFPTQTLRFVKSFEFVSIICRWLNRGLCVCVYARARVCCDVLLLALQSSGDWTGDCVCVCARARVLWCFTTWPYKVPVTERGIGWGKAFVLVGGWGEGKRSFCALVGGWVSDGKCNNSNNQGLTIHCEMCDGSPSNLYPQPVGF